MFLDDYEEPPTPEDLEFWAQEEDSDERFELGMYDDA